MLKITNKNKPIIQFCFSNPHIIKARQEIEGITEREINDLAASLKKQYGEDWFRFFLALRPVTLNKVNGVA